ncbi:response regulator [Iodobacter fluviatilis]|uniref:CheY-like chemotaxis protein n=1 Tax=Iodobacter fluviatilis TaxID=537 RepID=A0A377Q7J5_9NEIS|nr:response regulator [Iodobacter fluviatilis]TCU89318.1 CheY-like chemotaxis protein [Iodobacter fluviatilis]STQ90688.1 Sensor kinase protein RcsC [Iodobacter fluviatilis]
MPNISTTIHSLHKNEHKPILKNFHSDNEKKSYSESSNMNCYSQTQDQQVQTILIVEDHIVSQTTISHQIKELGYIPLIAKMGCDVLAMLGSAQWQGISLILMDCIIPDIDGYSISKYIRLFEKKHALPPIPIIAISANKDNDHRKKCIDSGMNGLLSKPLYPAELKKILHAWLKAPAGPASVYLPLTIQDLGILFIDSTNADLKELSMAVKLADNKRAINYAHRIYGSALSVDAKEIAEIAGKLERILIEEKQVNDSALQAIENLSSAIQKWEQIHS